MINLGPVGTQVVLDFLIISGIFSLGAAMDTIGAGAKSLPWIRPVGSTVSGPCLLGNDTNSISGFPVVFARTMSLRQSTHKGVLHRLRCLFSVPTCMTGPAEFL